MCSLPEFDYVGPRPDSDLVSKTYINSNYVDNNNFKKELIKVLEEGLKEISERLYSIEVTIENKLLVKD